MNNERALLRRTLEAWDEDDMEISEIFKEIRMYLEDWPDDVRPVAWWNGITPEMAESDYCIARLIRWVMCSGKTSECFIPLYTRPAPERKPMTEEEIDDESLRLDCFRLSFGLGVRSAEKHHGIGESL